MACLDGSPCYELLRFFLCGPESRSAFFEFGFCAFLTVMVVYCLYGLCDPFVFIGAYEVVICEPEHCSTTAYYEFFGSRKSSCIFAFLLLEIIFFPSLDISTSLSRSVVNSEEPILNCKRALTRASWYIMIKEKNSAKDRTGLVFVLVPAWHQF